MYEWVSDQGTPCPSDFSPPTTLNWTSGWMDGWTKLEDTTVCCYKLCLNQSDCCKYTNTLSRVVLHSDCNTAAIGHDRKDHWSAILQDSPPLLSNLQTSQGKGMISTENNMWSFTMQSFINETPGHLLDCCGYSTSIHPIANTAHNRRWAGGYPRCHTARGRVHHREVVMMFSIISSHVQINRPANICSFKRFCFSKSVCAACCLRLIINVL